MRLERTVSWSQTRRDTNFAIPGYSFFCHDTTANGKNKVFSVCGHSCGQSRFCAAFSNRGKSRKCRCRKALRRFASPYPGYRHGTPKPPALPAALHPDLFCFCDLGIYRILCGRCLIVTRSGEKEPKLPCVRLCCGSSEKARMRPSTLPSHLRYTRIHPVFAGGRTGTGFFGRTSRLEQRDTHIRTVRTERCYYTARRRRCQVRVFPNRVIRAYPGTVRHLLIPEF